MEINNYGQGGYIKEGADVMTFQVGNNPAALDGIGANTNASSTLLLQVDNHQVLTQGANNNLLEEIETTISNNRLLPELIEKQVKILYGKGPRLYTEEYNENKLVRTWVKNTVIEDWMNSWELNGLDSTAEELSMKILRRFYYFEEYYIRWDLRESRLMGRDWQRMGLLPPIIGMDLVENKRSRLATPKQLNLFTDDIESRDFTRVIVGNWTTGILRRFTNYPRFNLSTVLQHPQSISHHKNDAVDSIYGINKFYKGVKEWIKGANLTPLNINSFIHNSLAAKQHVIIPEAWCESKREMIRNYCEENQARAEKKKDLLSIKVGTKTIHIGTEYSESLFTQYLNAELRKLTSILSGPGNQGKIYASYSFRSGDREEQRWRFEPVDMKYKEYISSLLEYDKRADEVLLSAKGLDASISNISKDGIISKSGADVFYNYVIYLHTLSTAEQICMKPFNDAIRINFPAEYRSGVRIGLYNDVPQRQEDQAPKDRLVNQKQA